MPRDSTGFYSLPAGNPVAPGEIVEADWANTTMNDIAEALNWRIGFEETLCFTDGSESSPSFHFCSEPTTGIYRAGTGDMRVTILGGDEFRILDDGLFEWIDDPGEWRRLISSHDITIDDSTGDITIGADVTFLDEIFIGGDTLAEYITTIFETGGVDVGSSGLYRFWRVRWGSTKTISATISNGRLYTGGRGFVRGQRWDKGSRLDLDTVSMSGAGISEAVWKSFFSDGGTTNLALTFSVGAPDGSNRAGVEIDFGEGNVGHISGVDFEDSSVPGANVPTILEFSYSDDGVTWVVGSTIEEIDERIGYDVDPTVDWPHFGNISDTDPQTQFDRNKATIPFLDVPEGGGGGGGEPYWDFDNTVKTGNFTAESGKYYFLETENFFSPSTYTITMPSSPSIGDRVGFACNLTPASYPTIDSTADYTDHKFDVQWDAGAGVATQVSLGYDGPSSGPGTYVMSVELYYLSADNWVIMNISRASIPGS